MSEIQVSYAGAVCTVTINRPAQKNALSAAMYQSLAKALLAADADGSVHAIVFTGLVGIFTAGNDLGDFMAVASKPRTDAGAAIDFLQAIQSIQKPIIAAVDGPAVGIGTTLLMHCDAVVMGEKAYLHMPFVDLGLSAEGGSTVLLAKFIGIRKATAWLMGEKVTPQAALAAGFINQVVPAGEALTTATAMAEAWAKKPLASVVATKRLMKRVDVSEVKDAFLLESLQFGMLLNTAETQARFAQFFAAKK